MGRATAIFCPAPWGPGEGSKVQISFNFNYKVNFKILYQTLCVLTNKRYKTYQTGFSSCACVMSQRVGLEGAGCPGGHFFFKHSHVAYQIDEEDEQNRMQVKFSS